MNDVQPCWVDAQTWRCRCKRASEKERGVPKCGLCHAGRPPVLGGEPRPKANEEMEEYPGEWPLSACVAVDEAVERAETAEARVAELEKDRAWLLIEIAGAAEGRVSNDSLRSVLRVAGYERTSDSVCEAPKEKTDDAGTTADVRPPAVALDGPEAVGSSIQRGGGAGGRAEGDAAADAVRPSPPSHVSTGTSEAPPTTTDDAHRDACRMLSALGVFSPVRVTKLAAMLRERRTDYVPPPTQTVACRLCYGSCRFLIWDRVSVTWLPGYCDRHGESMLRPLEGAVVMGDHRPDSPCAPEVRP